MKPTQKIVLNHWLYGTHTITEPVLIELIQSPILERLKHIEQHGTWQLHQSYKKTNRFTRYDHSIGVMLLLRHFGASIEEQLHGLLHDISHTVFSHVADFLFGKTPGVHNYQDSRLKKAYQLQGVNDILTKHGFLATHILNEKNFPLAERSLPDLCADRLDYSIQDPWGRTFDTVRPQDLLNNLLVFKKQFVFSSQYWAKRFATLYEKHNQHVWCSIDQIAIYTLSAQMLRAALDEHIITKQELYTTDEYVVKKLQAAKHPTIQTLLKKIKTVKAREVTKAQADFWSTSKPRVVDPLFLRDGNVVRLTDVDTVYKKRIGIWKARIKKGFYIKLV